MKIVTKPKKAVRPAKSKLSNYVKQARKVLDIEAACLKDLRDRLNGDFNTAVELMLDTLKQQGKIVVTGVGKSGHIGEKIAATLTSTGAPAVFLNPLNAIHGDMGLIDSRDLILALSYSGDTEELIRILPSLKRFQAKIVAMTGKLDSELARSADVCLDTSVEQEACPLNLAPTSSTTTMLALGDALAMVLLETRGFEKEDFAKYHPGGTLGKRLLLKIDQVMRPLEKVASCGPNDTVLQAIQQMNQTRCGATVIIDSKGTLAGIFTHGDFARGYSKDSKIGDRKLSEVMIPSPITVQVDKLAVEALNIFEKHRIQDLIVLDKARRPVGLIDIQDLAKQNLI